MHHVQVKYTNTEAMGFRPYISFCLVKQDPQNLKKESSGNKYNQNDNFLLITPRVKIELRTTKESKGFWYD